MKEPNFYTFVLFGFATQYLPFINDFLQFLILIITFFYTIFKCRKELKNRKNE